MKKSKMMKICERESEKRDRDFVVNVCTPVDDNSLRLFAEKKNLLNVVKFFFLIFFLVLLL